MALTYSRCITQLKLSLESLLVLRSFSSLPKRKSSQVQTQEKNSALITANKENRVTYELPKAPPNYERKTALQLFFTNDSNLAVNVISFVNAVQFTPYGLKKAWRDINDKKLYLSQRYVPERTQFLGPELATAHFVCYRGGKVKFYNRENWFKMDPDTEEVENLPRFFNSDYKIEAVDCSKMELIYEGLENIKNMECPKWFSFEGSPHIDDWCLDRIAGEYGHCVEHLNVKDCPKVTESGIACLSKMKKLKTLTIGGHPKAKHLELVCLMLEDVLPDIIIRGIVYCDESLLQRNPEN